MCVCTADRFRFRLLQYIFVALAYLLRKFIRNTQTLTRTRAHSGSYCQTHLEINKHRLFHYFR